MLYQEMLDEKRVIASKEGPLTDQEMTRLRVLNERLAYYTSPWPEPRRNPYMDMFPEKVAECEAIVNKLIAKLKAKQG